MNRNNYIGDGIQGEITGKADPDTDELSKRSYDAADSMFGGKVYPHGGNVLNLQIIRNELLFSWGEQIGSYGEEGSVRPMVWSSFNGLYVHDVPNPECLKRKLKFEGIAKGDYLYGGDSYDGQAPLNMPIGVVKAGSLRVTNLSGQDVYCGDDLEWDIPPFVQNTLGSAITEYNSPADPYSQNGYSQTPGKLLGFFKKVDYTNFDLEIGMVQVMNSVGSDGNTPGIQSLKADDLLNGDSRSKLTPDQEEALAIKLGVLGLMAMGAELWQNTPGNDIDAFINTLLKDANGVALKSFVNTKLDKDNPPRTEFEKIKQNIVRILMGGINGARCAKQSRVVAQAVGSAGPGEDMTVILRGGN